MDNLEDIKKRVDHLQYDEISSIKEEINGMKISISNNDLLTSQSLESNHKLSETIDVLKSTMIEIAQSVKDSNRINGEITKTIEELNKKIASVESSTKKSIDEFSSKLDNIDEKSKIDILDWLRDKWFEILVSAIGISYVVSQYIGK